MLLRCETFRGNYAIWVPFFARRAENAHCGSKSFVLDKNYTLTLQPFCYDLHSNMSQREGPPKSFVSKILLVVTGCCLDTPYTNEWAPIWESVPTSNAPEGVQIYRPKPKHPQ